MKTLVDFAVPTTTFIMLVAVGLDLTTKDFARVRQQRLLVLAGLFAPLLLLPPIAVGLTRLFEAPADVAAGVLLIAACPIGSVSNAYCYLARGAAALSIALTGLSSLLASLTIPLAGKGIELALARPFELQVPTAVLAAQLLLILALPVVLGMWGRRHAPSLAQRLSPLFQRLALTGILLVFALVILDDAAAFAGELSTTVPLAAVFVLASFAAGWLTAAVLAADRRDRFAIAAGFGARHVGIATAIAVTILGRLEFARFAATYSFVEVPLMLAAAALFRRLQDARSTSASDISEHSPVGRKS